MRLPFASYLDAIGEDLERLDRAARRDLKAPVPSCPTWDVLTLVEHLTRVYRFWTAQLEAEDATVRVVLSDESPADDVLFALEGQATSLLGAIASAGPERACWNWSGHEQNSAWIARRVAHETGIHRVDVELAFGPPSPIERELAIDGVDERLEIFLVDEPRREPTPWLGGSICLICKDAEAAWIVDAERGRPRWRQGRGPADAALVGTASQLNLFAWNRVDASSLELTGSRAVADSWRALPGA